MPSIKPLSLILTITLLISGCSTMQERPGEQASTVETKEAQKKITSALEQDYAAALKSMREGKTERAKRQFEQLAEKNPELAGPQTNLGIIQLKENDPAAAEQSFRNAIKSNPQSAEAHNQLGLVLRLQGRFQEAEQAYQTALEVEPVYRLAHRNLGILYDLYLAKPEQALEHYRVCQKLAETEDREIEGWIIDLERRVKAAK
ncbi:MAG: tetratricopeptide repeat protein [Candidatus Thiodiazotropha sp. (ex Monitilora ramsayi)]|nr:tetratricopeptide repeat protein [Candidatus Thiodiazotropha sp. (ex Monitilora ramsayi)]